MRKLIIERLTVADLKVIIAEAMQESLKQRQSEDEFLNVIEASEYLKIPVTTIYDYTSNKKIPFHKKGKKLHFSKHELNAWMKSKNKESEVSHD
jgi:excisionase family DNA binding protein